MGSFGNNQVGVHVKLSQAYSDQCQRLAPQSFDAHTIASPLYRHFVQPGNLADKIVPDYTGSIFIKS